jgi:signal transduction histidine kinase
LGAIRTDIPFPVGLSRLDRLAGDKESPTGESDFVAEAEFLQRASARIDQELFLRRFANWRLTLTGMTGIAWMIAAMYRYLYPDAVTLYWAVLQTLAFVVVAIMCLCYELRRPVDLDSIEQRNWMRGWIVSSAIASAIAGSLPAFLPAEIQDAQLSSAALVSIMMIAFVVSRANRMLIHASVASYAISLSLSLILHARVAWAVPLCLLYTGMLLAMGLMLNAALRRAIGDQLYARYLHGELRRSHSRQLAVQQREAALNERQRMMSDLHDGFGAQLVGSLHQLESGHIGVDGAITALRECIDDLRLTVDAHEPSARSLVTLLGMLRYRMQARIKSTGVQLAWHIEDLPDTVALSPAHSLDVLRIVQQGIANVLQHAGATEITVVAQRLPRRLEISVADNGKGIDPVVAMQNGRGISNMQRRAARLGAELLFEPGERGGTVLRLRLHWPMDGAL